MKIYTNILIMIFLCFVSCKNLGNNNAHENAHKDGKEKLSDDVQESSNAAESIAESILGVNLRIKTIDLTESSSSSYDQLFSRDGITKVVAYYDKSAKPINQPVNFEEFLLFVATYDNSINAKKAFARIKADADKCNSKERVKIDKDLNDRIKLLNLGTVHGGLITQNGNQVFSLVENCNISPMGNTWLECEYMFTDLLKNKQGYVEVLKAGCNEGRYYGGRREVR